MERLNLELVRELSRTHDVRVVAPQESLPFLPPGVGISTRTAATPLASFLTAAMIQTARAAFEWRPSIVLAGSGLLAPHAWLGARLSGARACAYVHGLDLALPHPLYRLLWLPWLRRLDLVIANSIATARLATRVGIAPGHLAIVHPGTELPEPDPGARERFRLRHGLPLAAPLLLSVGRLTPRKGLRPFLRDVLPRIVAARPDVVLVIVGGSPRGALHARGEDPSSLLEEARRAGVASRVHFVGTLTDTSLSEAYAAADVFVFPVRDDPRDPEGFGMVAIEAAAHGLATVAYDTGGVGEAVAHGRSGFLVPPGDEEDFARRVLELLAHPLSRAEPRRFAQAYSWSAFGERLRAALDPTALDPEGGPPPPPCEQIGVVSVSYHPDPSLLRRQLAGLPQRVPKVVVENTPPDARTVDLATVLGDLPAVRVIDAGENLGLARGLDLGVEILRAWTPPVTHVLFLDQDSELREGGLEALGRGWRRLEAAGRNPGAVGPRLLDAHSGTFHALHRAGSWLWRRLPSPFPPAPAVAVSNLNGSGTFTSLAVYEKLGGFEQTLGIDHVDTEWSFRVLAAGYTLWCLPEATLLHRMGRGSVRFWFWGWRIWPLRSPERHRSLFRNTRILLARPYVPRVWKFWAIVKLGLTVCVHGLFGPERWAQLRAMVQGFHEGRASGREQRRHGPPPRRGEASRG